MANENKVSVASLSNRELFNKIDHVLSLNQRLREEQVKILKYIYSGSELDLARIDDGFAGFELRNMVKELRTRLAEGKIE